MPTDEEQGSEQSPELLRQKQVPELLAVEKALVDAVTAYAQEHNGLHEGNVITVPGYPDVTVTVTAGAEGQPFGLDVKGVVISDPRNR